MINQHESQIFIHSQVCQTIISLHDAAEHLAHPTLLQLFPPAWPEEVGQLHTEAAVQIGRPDPPIHHVDLQKPQCTIFSYAYKFMN